MKKLFLIPVLAAVLGVSWTVAGTPEANARDYDRHDRHDRYHGDYNRHDRDDWDDHDWDDDDYDRYGHRGHGWHRGHSNVHYHVRNGHRVRCSLNHHERDHRRYDRRHIGYGHYNERYRHDRGDYENRSFVDRYGRSHLNTAITRFGFRFD